MARQSIASSQRSLLLNEEEALALLEICLYTNDDDSVIRTALMTRIGDLCRDFLHPLQGSPKGAGCEAEWSRLPHHYNNARTVTAAA